MPDRHFARLAPWSWIVAMTSVAVFSAAGIGGAQDAATKSGNRTGATGRALPDYAAGLQRVNNLLTKYPKLVAKRTIGKSVQGRELFVLRVGVQDPAKADVPEMYLGGGIHGHERSELDALWMTEQLLAQSTIEPVKTLLQSRTVWVQPMVNPDGLVLDQRKNAHGVDLNRNFGGIRQHRGLGDPDGSRYPGPRGFSEPETRAVRDFLLSRENLRVYLDLHRSVRLIVIPEVDRLGRPSQPCLDAFGPLNAAMQNHHSFRGKFQFDQWGFSIDWVWRRLGVVAFAWELKDEHSTDVAEDPRWRGLLHLLENTGTYERYATPRFATFNVSLHRATSGALVEELKTTHSAQAQAIAEVLQRTRPDVVLLNEVDWDAQGAAIALLQKNYLSRSQGGVEPIEYPHVFVAPSNTGVDSGFDLDNDDRLGGPGDAFGFGSFPGQYGMVLLSRYPIDAKRTRTFREFRWKDMPNSSMPENWFTNDERDAVRLASKSHWDVVVTIRGVPVHVLCAHPTPPVFDGPEDRNGRRNHDEIRLFADYITPGRGHYIVDDRGVRGGIAADEHFVILGDYNADPLDGDSRDAAISQLLDHPRVHANPAPASRGATESSARLGGVNTTHRGSAAHDTGSFGKRAGNLRLDYALPSKSLRIVQNGVFWPKAENSTHGLVGDGAKVVSSDHRLVWVDVEFRR